MQMHGITYRWKQDEYRGKEFDDRTHLGFVVKHSEK